MNGNQAATYLIRLSDSEEELKHAKEAADAADVPGNVPLGQIRCYHCTFKVHLVKKRLHLCDLVGINKQRFMNTLAEKF